MLLLIGVVAAFVIPHDHPRFTGPLHDLTIPSGDPNWERSCPPNRVSEARSCVNAAVFDVNLARHEEDLPPLVLPRGFVSDSFARQLLYLVNNERTIRSLTTFPGLDPSLDRDALAGAQRARDPAIPGTGAGGSDWAGNFPNPVVVDFLWMYEDGFRYTNGGGGSNLDCQRPKASGCWGHRQVILTPLAGGSEIGTAFTTNLVPAQRPNYFSSYAIVLTGSPTLDLTTSNEPVADGVSFAGIVLIVWGILRAARGHRRRRTVAP